MVFRLTNENGTNWKLAFTFGACLAVLEKALLLAKGFPLDRLFIGVDAFLIIGGAGFLLNIRIVLYICGTLIQATLFASLVAVGILTTFLSGRGFVGVEHQDRRRVMVYSLYLLAVATAAFLVSLVFRGNNILAGALPFAGIVIVKRTLVKMVREPAVDGETN